jgi:hypothetical protein
MVQIFKLQSLRDFDFLNDKDIFIFSQKLKDDLILFKRNILDNTPDLIIGFAKTNRRSRFESKAVNIFNRSKKVIKCKRDFYKLFIPNTKDFLVNYRYTDSYCNWVMFNICAFIEEQGLQTKFIFLHANKNDSDLLKGFIEKLEHGYTHF